MQSCNTADWQSTLSWTVIISLSSHWPLPLSGFTLIAYLENHLICINVASTKLKAKKAMGLHLKPKAEVPLLALIHLSHISTNILVLWFRPDCLCSVTLNVPATAAWVKHINKANLNPHDHSCMALYSLWDKYLMFKNASLKKIKYFVP